MGKARTDEQRADDRKRKRRSRENIAASEEEQQLAELRQRDPVAARVQEIMAHIAQEPRQPRPPRPPESPQPAGLPSLSVWSRYLKSIPQTQAIAEEIIRVEAAIQCGQTEFPV